jgi:hypothetical protein
MTMRHHIFMQNTVSMKSGQRDAPPVGGFEVSFLSNLGGFV